MKTKTMTITKDDMRRIDSDVRKVCLRIDAKVSDYARLYEKTYLLKLREEIDRQLFALDEYNKRILELSQPNIE